MTKEQFLAKMPHTINHESHGISHITAGLHESGDCGVLWRTKDGHSSYATYEKSWQELYDNLYPFLKERGHIA